MTTDNCGPPMNKTRVCITTQPANANNQPSRRTAGRSRGGGWSARPPSRSSPARLGSPRTRGRCRTRRRRGSCLVVVVVVVRGCLVEECGVVEACVKRVWEGAAVFSPPPPPAGPIRHFATRSIGGPSHPSRGPNARLPTGGPLEREEVVRRDGVLQRPRHIGGHRGAAPDGCYGVFLVQTNGLRGVVDRFMGKGLDLGLFGGGGGSSPRPSSTHSMQQTTSIARLATTAAPPSYR